MKMNTVTHVEIAFNNAGDTFMTNRFQLRQWKHLLRLEATGMTMTRGHMIESSAGGDLALVKVSTHLRKLMGLKRNYPLAGLSSWVEAALDNVNEQLTAGTDEENNDDL